MNGFWESAWWVLWLLGLQVALPQALGVLPSPNPMGFTPLQLTFMFGSLTLTWAYAAQRIHRSPSRLLLALMGCASVAGVWWWAQTPTYASWAVWVVFAPTLVLALLLLERKPLKAYAPTPPEATPPNI